MKILRLLMVGLALTTFFAVSIIAQAEKKPDITPVKFAAVDTKAFKDKESGIKDLVIAYEQLETEFKLQLDELKISAAKLQEIEKKYFRRREYTERETGKNIQSLTQEVNAKFEEYQKLVSEFKAKLENYKSLCEKRKSEIVTPINNKIGDTLKQFAAQKGYALILDITALSCDCISEDNTPNVTAEFIKFCNDTFSKEKAQ